MTGPEPRPGLGANEPAPPSAGLIVSPPVFPLCVICILASVSGGRRWKWDLDHALREAAPIGRSASWSL